MDTSNVKILSTGVYLPEPELSNFDIEKIVDTSDEWIRTRTGIQRRRIARREEATSDLAYRAAKMALDRASIKPEDIELIIVATVTPDMFFPSTGCFVQNLLGAKNAVALDINAACSGYIYSFVIASKFLASGSFKNALVIGAEKLSSIVDWEDRSTCVIFADGAGASVLVPSNGDSKLLAFDMGTDGSFGSDLFIPGGGSRNPASFETVSKRMHYIKMNGNKIFKIAVNKMRETFEKSMVKAGISASDISLVIPHQANLRIIESLRSYLKIPKDKVYVNIERYGNTSAASIAIALHEAIEIGRIKRGDIIGFAAFGGGLTWGSAIIKY